MNHFFAYVFRMRHILRWSLMRNAENENLSEHTAEVAVVAHALAVIGNTYFGKRYDPDRAASLALFHDAPEVLTGDLPTPIKYFSDEMRSAYRNIEDQAVGNLLDKLPSEMRATYASLLCPEASDAEEARLVKLADKLCAYIKCLTEEAGGNRDFLSAKKSIEEELRRKACPELTYFCEHFLDGFSLTIDEM